MKTILRHTKLPNVVYHYCTVETFFHIISNHTLRLSDIEKSNDFMEKKWAIRQCLQHIENNLSNPAYPCAEQPELASALLAEMKRQFHDYNTMILAACFSSRRDLLSQWRGYGDNGYGVCIGVASGTEFREAFRRAERYLILKGSCSLPSGLLFHSIKYSTKEIEATCMRLFCIYMRWLPLRTSVEAAAAELVRMMYPALPFFKSSAFSEEAEWRCVYYPELPAPPPPEPQLFEALEQLAVKYRLPLMLHCAEGYSVAEVADMLRLPVGAVKWRIGQARRELASIMEKERA